MNNNVTVFNRKLLDFADDLRAINKLLPDAHIPEIDLFKPAVQLAITVNERKPRQVFDMYVAKRYASQIREQDEAFFLDTSFLQDDVCTSRDSLDIVALLQKVWRRLDDATKNAIWQHLGVLLVLNERCINS